MSLIPLCFEEGADKGAELCEDALGAVRNHVEAQIKALEEPDDDGRYKDNSKGFPEKILGFFPHQKQDAFGRGDSVSGEFHYKGNRVPAENGAFQEQPGKDGDKDADTIDGNHHQRPMFRKKGGDNHAVDREFCRAGHKGGQKNGHFPVPGRFSAHPAYLR